MKPILPLLAALLAGSCSSSNPAPATAPANAWEAQVARGAEVFGATCAKCHGKAGEGTKKGPALVGASALPLDPRPDAERTTQFHTAMDVAAFATTQMPPDEKQRAKMTEAQYWDVLAFALSANGVKRDQPVGPGNAAQIQLH